MKSATYYDLNAEEFFAATVSADMAETRDRFLYYLPLGGHVLDAGCGSGRDALAFLDAGYQVTAFDASKALVARATDHTGLPVLHMTFEEMTWIGDFDGVWACASLLHVHQAELPKIMTKLSVALKPQGVLYGSFKYGVGEVQRDGRTFTNQTEESLDNLMKIVPSLLPIEVWMSHDVRPGRTDKWLNFLYKREGH
jgi:SAM-dependent methyltransferase